MLVLVQVQLQVQVAAVPRQAGMEVEELGSPIRFGGSSKHPRRMKLGLLQVVHAGLQSLQRHDVLPAEVLHLQMRLLLPMVQVQLLRQLLVLALPLPDRTVALPDLWPGVLVMVEGLPMPPLELLLGKKM